MEGPDKDERGCFTLRFLDRASDFNATGCSRELGEDENAPASSTRKPGDPKRSPWVPSVSVPHFLIISGSRLRVCRNFLLEMAFEAGVEQEKTFSSP